MRAGSDSDLFGLAGSRPFEFASEAWARVGVYGVVERSLRQQESEYPRGGAP